MGGYRGGSPNTGYYAAQNFFDQITGVAGVDYGALTLNYVGIASGAVWGGNPPYTLSDFCAIYPKFFGTPNVVTGITVAPTIALSVLAQGSNVVTVTDATGIQVGYGVTGLGLPWQTPVTVTAINGLNITISQPALLNGTIKLKFFDTVTSYQITGVGASNNPPATGQFITGPGIAPGTLVVSFADNIITLSQQVIASGTVSFNTYPSPWMPLVVIQLFINLASASVMSPRWGDTWTLAMGLFIAHFCTLWMRSETGPNTTAAQIVQTGLQVGILTSKSVGDVSAGIETLKGFLVDWGDWNLTVYGIQFATFAAAMGSGPIWVGSAPGGPGGYYGGPSFGVI